MKTAGQIDGEVLLTAGEFARCPALNEPPAKTNIRILVHVAVPLSKKWLVIKPKLFSARTF